MKIIIILTVISGITFVFITNNIRNEEEVHLKTQEMIASSANKQVLSLKEELKKYEEFKHSITPGPIRK